MLSSEEKRRIYDRYGEDGLKQHDAQGGGGGGGAADIFSQCDCPPHSGVSRGSAQMLVGQPQAEHLLAQPAQLCVCNADSLHSISIFFGARACFCISDHGSACCPVTPHLRRLFIAKATAVPPPIRFFGGAFGGGFGFGGGEEEEQTPKGHDMHVDLEVSLRDLYVGTTVRVRLACLGRWSRTLHVSYTFPVLSSNHLVNTPHDQS